MEKKTIIGLVGPMVAGKGTIATYLEERYHAATFRFSDVLRETLTLYDLELSRTNLQNLSTILRHQFGENILAKAMFRRVREAQQPLIVIDGIRRLVDIELVPSLGSFTLISVHADDRIRFERLQKRTENSDDQKKTFEAFLQDQQQEAEREIAAVAAQAQLQVDNNGDINQLYARIDSIIQTIHGNSN